MTTTVAVLNQKGGPGKTTIATNLACQLSANGHTTLLVDLDPQGSASAWHEERDEDNATPGPDVVRMGKKAHSDLPHISRSYDWVVIDGAPNVTELAATAIRAADIVLIPIQPSPYDCWAAADLVDLIKARQMATDGIPKAAFVVSRAIKGTTLSREITEALKDYELPVFKRGTVQRVDYINTAKTGRSVVNLDEENKARIEIKMLTKELMEFSND